MGYLYFIFIDCCMSSVYILDINPLSDTLFANIYSHSVGYVFVLLIVSFAMQQLFDVFLFVYFCFCFLCGGRQIRNNIPEIEVSMYISYVFLEYYGFISFIYLIHFEILYVYDMRK